MIRFEARDAIVAQLELDGLLVSVEDHVHAVAHCQRCGTVIEPLLSTQWFVKIKPMAESALDRCCNGKDHLSFPIIGPRFITTG